MPSVRDVLTALEEIAPAKFALPGDRIGLQLGDIEASVKRVIVSLDHSGGAVQACIDRDAELLLCHHPLIMNPLGDVNYGEPIADRVRDMITNRVAYIAAHTNWDCAPGGVNDALAESLGLAEVTAFGTAATFDALKVVVFCPAEAVDAVLDAASEAGGGTICNYRRCAFSSPGYGTFEAAPAALPAIGKAGVRNTVAEVRVEMEVPTSRREAIDAAIRSAHPYEEPAIDFLMASKRGHPICRKGRLHKPLSPIEFREFIDQTLGFRTTSWDGGAQLIEWVGVCGGAASDEWAYALAAGCDAFVTGEVKQHHALDASEQGLTICAAGHYATEQPGVVALAATLQNSLPAIAWTVFEPEPGMNGRPN